MRHIIHFSRNCRANTCAFPAAIVKRKSNRFHVSKKHRKSTKFGIESIRCKNPHKFFSEHCHSKNVPLKLILVGATLVGINWKVTSISNTMQLSGIPVVLTKDREGAPWQSRNYRNFQNRRNNFLSSHQQHLTKRRKIRYTNTPHESPWIREEICMFFYAIENLIHVEILLRSATLT